MNDFAIFFVLACGAQLVPMICVCLGLLYVAPYPSVSYILSPRIRASRRQRSPGITVVEQFLQILDADLLEYMTRFYLLALLGQTTVMIIIIACIFMDVPLPYMPYIEDVLPEGIFYDLLKFSVALTIAQILMVFLLLFGMIFEIPLLFMPPPQMNREPPTAEIINLERYSEDFVSIHLTRFQNSERVIIYANCVDDRTGVFFKLALCKEKMENSRTECYLYDDLDPIEDEVNIIPDLDEIYEIPPVVRRYSV